ncbi:MAG: SUMF1/EgtB/PvdO family nonheme iron enzyme [Planctomycetota bacterium]
MKTIRTFTVFILLCACLAAPHTAVSDEDAKTDAAGNVPAKTIEASAEDLESRFYYDRYNAVRELIAGGKKAVPALRERLHSEDGRMVAQCIDALVIINATEALPDLVELSSGADVSMQVLLPALRAIYVFDPFDKALDALASSGKGEQVKKVRALMKKYPEAISHRFDLERYLRTGREFKNSGVILTMDQQAEVKSQVATIAQLLKAGKKNEALDACQALLDMDLTRPMADPGDEHVAICYSASHIPEVADTILANLQLYRRLFDKKAGKKFDAIIRRMDVAALDRFLRAYGYTSQGLAAFETSIAFHFEYANFREAVWTWERHHTLFDNISLVTLGRVAYAYAKIAQPDPAGEMLKRVRKEFPGAKVLVAGAEADLAAFLEETMKKAPKEPKGDITLNRNLGFDSPLPSEGDVAEVNTAASRWVRSVDYFKERVRTLGCIDGEGKRVYVPTWVLPENADEKTKRDLELRTGLKPTGGGSYTASNPPGPYLAYPYSVSVYKDWVVAANGVKVYCYSLSKGKVLWIYDNSSDDIELAQLDAWVMHPKKFNYVTISPEEQCAYVTIQAGDLVHKGIEDSKKGKVVGRLDAMNTITCLDLKTGKRRWSTENGNDFLKKISFDSPPVYKNGVIYACVLMPDPVLHSSALETCAIALDARNGELLWSTIMSGWRRLFNRRGDKPDMLPSAPLVLEDTVLVQSNSGTLASLAVRSGTLMWVAKYDQAYSGLVSPHSPNEQAVFGHVSTEMSNRPLVIGEAVYTLPVDSDYLFAHDLSSGRLLWRSLVREFPADAVTRYADAARANKHHLLADKDGTIYLVGQGVMAIDRNRGELLWSVPQEVVTAKGRPILQDNKLIISANGGYHRIIRGGSWSSVAKATRSANRGWFEPVLSNNNIGFRVAAIVAASMTEKRIVIPPGKPDAQPVEIPALYEPVTTAGKDEATGLWKEIVHAKSGITLHLLPAGEFDMGSPSGETGRESIEGPVHRVKIGRPLYIGKHEVTQKQWTTIMKNNPSHFKGDNLPVESVSWDDAQEFCKQAGDGLRLPSEAEWEYACRAGSKTRWHFGDSEEQLGEYAWYKDDPGQKTHEVGTKKPNDWELYDMYGNVQEWCNDIRRDSYICAPGDGEAWTTGGVLTVLDSATGKVLENKGIPLEDFRARYLRSLMEEFLSPQTSAYAREELCRNYRTAPDALAKYAGEVGGENAKKLNELAAFIRIRYAMTNPRSGPLDPLLDSSSGNLVSGPDYLILTLADGTIIVFGK